MEIAIVVSNFIYAILGALLTILLMVLGYKILDWGQVPFSVETHRAPRFAQALCRAS